MPVTVMSKAGLKRNFKLLRKWEYRCIVCGHTFANMACVTVEHIIPVSLGRFGRREAQNLAPSHWNCNAIKANRSLRDAAAYVKQLENRLGSEQFFAWISKKVPGRAVPWYGLIPVVDAEWFVM